MKHTICTPAGKIVIDQSATRASAQIAFFPADGRPIGFLLPNALAGVFTSAVEEVVTLNEESAEPELPIDLALAHRFAAGMPELAE